MYRCIVIIMLQECTTIERGIWFIQVSDFVTCVLLIISGISSLNFASSCNDARVMPVPLNEVKVQQQDGKNENDTPNTAPVPKIQSKKPPMPPPSSSTSDNDGEKRRSIHSAPPARDDQPIDDVEKRKAEEAEKRQRAQREADEKQRAEERRVAEQQLEQKRLADQAAEEACIQREADAKRAAIDAEAKRVADERQAQLDKQAAQQKQQEQQVKKSEEESDRQQMVSCMECSRSSSLDIVCSKQAKVISAIHRNRCQEWTTDRCSSQ